VWRRLQSTYWTYAYMWRTHAPWWLIRQRRSKNKTLAALDGPFSAVFFEELEVRWSEAVRKRRFDVDWFSAQIPSWATLLDQLGLRALTRPRCLEIGSWQGMSAVFLLTYLEDSVITCVDTWEGSPEHTADILVEQSLLESIESTFDENIAEFATRVTKFRGSSLEFFAQCQMGTEFDLVYVDGSHHSDDVLCDAVLAFRHLSPGGVLIFDDYSWRYFERDIHNPASAIHAFLRLKRHELIVVAIGDQLFVQKL